jgi:hypothetical protein
MVELRQSLLGEKVENTLAFRKDGGFSTVDMTGLCNDLLLWWTTVYRGSMSIQLTIRELVCTDLSTQTGPVVTVVAPTPNPAGMVVQDSEPGNVSLCVSFRTIMRGRSYRGRNFVAGIPITARVGNTVTAGFAANIQGAYNALPASIVTSPWEWVVVSRFTNGAPRVAGAATPVESAAVVDNNIDSMRRRLAGRGQ